MQPRDVTTIDLSAIHALNAAAVPAVNDVGPADLAWFLERAAYFRLVEIEAEPAGFLLALGTGLAYSSLNYAWFSVRYGEFAYIDRLAVGASWRRRGIASILYADLERQARAWRAPRLACEVNLRPYNAESLAFHARHGFAEVGQQDTDGGAKTVSLMTKELLA